MCRLTFIPGKAKISKANLLKHLDHLEGQCGGDGNGFVSIHPNGKTVIFDKGVKLPNAVIASKVYGLMRDGWATYYHTRKVSVGWLTDTQCHPFPIIGKKFNGFLCHNGTWFEGGTLAKYFNVGSDTAALAKLLGRFTLKELDAKDLFPSSGVFLLFGAKPGETPIHTVIKLMGDLEYCPSTGVFASSFSRDWPHWQGTYEVKNGKHMLTKVPPRDVRTVGYYVSPSPSKKNYGIGNYQPHGAGHFDPNKWYGEDWENDWEGKPSRSYRYKDTTPPNLPQDTDSTYVDRNLLDGTILP